MKESLVMLSISTLERNYAHFKLKIFWIAFIIQMLRILSIPSDNEPSHQRLHLSHSKFGQLAQTLLKSLTI